MTHRASQIIDAAKALIEARVGPSGTKVYTHRRQSLSPTQDETPAVSVDSGDDEPSEDTTTEIYSELTVETTAKVYAPSEPEAHENLASLRREIHRALMAGATAGLPYSVTIGLAFVENIYYRGASAPEADPEGEQFVGSQTSRWAVLYRMNLDDPGDD